MYLGWDYNIKYDIAINATSFIERVTVLELYVVYKALRNLVFVQEAQRDPKLRIITDCYNVVYILQSKPMIENMVAADIRVDKYCRYILELLCSVGLEIKPLYDYYINHIFFRTEQ